MRLSYVSLLCVALLVAVCRAQDDETDWKDYKRAQKKNYADAKEENQRKVLFLETNKNIKRHNAKNVGWSMAHNHLSDLTNNEKEALLGARRFPKAQDSRNKTVAVPSSRQVFASFDLRADDCLPSVRDQGQCGSCWAFAAVTPLEFGLCKKSGSNTSSDLSEQQLVDCDPYNSGCNGGWMIRTWYYLKYVATFIGTESAYPYTSGTTETSGTCKQTALTTASRVALSTMKYYQIASLDHISMANALTIYGPLAVAMHVVFDFYNYAAGVYASLWCSRRTVNHAVVIVGFGVDDATGQPFWVVRNSWGSGWGSSGYILIMRGVNMCNIERYAYFPIV